MKSLSLSRPLVIMMLGVPGAGKSFFARQFADMFSAPLVSHDRIRFELFSEPKFAKDEESIVSRVGLVRIEELLKTKKTFIIDGGMDSRTVRLGVEKLARIHGYGTLVIWVQTDPQTTKFRSLRRNSKRIYDTYNTSLTSEIYDKVAKGVTPPSPREPYIVISGKHTFATQAKIVLRKLVTPREISETPVTVDAQVRPPQNPPAPSPTRRNVTIN